MGNDAPTEVHDETVYNALRNYFQTLLHPDVIDQVPQQGKRKFRDKDFAKRPYEDTIAPNRQELKYVFGRFDFVDGYNEVVDALKSCSFYDIRNTPEGAALNNTFTEFF